MTSPVKLVVDSETAYNFETTGEAIAYAESLVHCERFDIYTLYKSGIVSGIKWKLATDTATNLRECSKKPKNKRAMRPWTALEFKTLEDNYINGVDVSRIAEILNRSSKSCSNKLYNTGMSSLKVGRAITQSRQKTADESQA